MGKQATIYSLFPEDTVIGGQDLTCKWALCKLMWTCNFQLSLVIFVSKAAPPQQSFGNQDPLGNQFSEHPKSLNGSDWKS